MTEYPNLYSSGSLGGKTAPNRIVSQPMEGNDSDSGDVSQRTIDRYAHLAIGGWGTIIIEAVSITDNCLARKNQLVIKQSNLDGYKKLVDTIKKEAPDTLVQFQITHSGRKGGKAFSNPYAMYSPGDGERLLVSDDLERIKDDFIAKTLLFEKTGADGVDFKLCHGYLGCEMLRPANIRNDKWGGSFENRTRMLRECISAIRDSQKSDNFILGGRISLYEGIRGGCGTEGSDELTEDFTEMDSLIGLMNELKMDYVNVSAGIPGLTSEITRPTRTSRLFYLHQFRYARRISEISRNLKVIGSAYSVLEEVALELADENIRKGYADFAGWGRQSLADPHFPAKVTAGKPVDYCKACSGCSKLMIKQVHVGCTVFNEYYRSQLKGA
ncbi:MAG: hypothetical protein JEZ04_11490 [Spirochaetales bacterium]|nr:hypothetical protein [Spirochaetales bacterium]